jgi:hypothetical protein
MKTFESLDAMKEYKGYMRLNRHWHLSKTLLSHNCKDLDEVNTDWCHTSRFNEPLVCYGCGEQAPEKIEKIARLLFQTTGNQDSELVPPFTSHLGKPGAKERWEASQK